jgi:integrating conjugative element protein (TIGR03765 family)
MQANPALVTLCLVSAGVIAEALPPPRSPRVVYEGPDTIAAQPFYPGGLDTGSAGAPMPVAPDGVGVRPLAERLPLSPAHLVAGRPHLQTVPGLVTPLFVMGMDSASLRWFDSAARGLAAIGARGLVVQAQQRADWQALRRAARAQGIDLRLMADDALAVGYGLETYPVVLMSPAQAAVRAHE